MLALRVDDDPASVTVALDAAQIIGLGTPSPAKGTALVVYATSRGATFGSIEAGSVSDPTTMAEDRIPDADALVYTTQNGVDPGAGLLLSTPTPWRASNGEATTFVHDVRVENPGDEDRLVTLSVADRPSHWAVRVPSESFQIAAGQSVHIPVAVTTTFEHEHGSWRSAVIEAESSSGDVARLELGVSFPTVPQPSGHHPRLYLHSHAPAGLISRTGEELGRSQGTLYLNALAVEDDEPQHAQSGLVRGNGTPPLPAAYVATWRIQLEPPLSMGLQFAPEPGEMAVQVSSDLDLADARLGGHFVLETEETDTVVATIRGEPADLEAGAPVEVAARVEAVLDRLRHDFQADAQLELRLELHWSAGPADAARTGSDPAEVSLHPGGSILMPLDTYRDNAVDAFQGLHGIRLAAGSPVLRMANPGTTAVFNLTVLNDGAIRDTFKLNVTGPGSQWSRIVGGADVDLQPSQAATRWMVVDVPSGATDGETADLLVHATSRADPGVQGLLRFLVEVDTDAEHRDDAGLAAGLGSGSQGEGSPTAGLGLVVVAIVLAARRKAA